MSDVQEKAGRVLNIILLAFVLIAVRVWYLAILKHEEHKEISRRPQIKTVIEEPCRGTIRDRFGIPLAVNKISYNAAICYDPIRHLPRIKWILDKDGKRKKVFFRKEYIEKLAKKLASELNLEATMIEDLIYSKASIFPNTPFVIKEDISEKDYYRLHILERDFPGLAMQIHSKRYYPRKEVGSHIIGYLGSIAEKEYTLIQTELHMLEEYLHDKKLGLPAILPQGYLSSKEVKKRYQELKNKSYTINSKVGKSGIEGKFDDALRGTSGKSKYEVDTKGNIIRKLPDSYPEVPGRRFILSLSSELQEYAEKLLIESEMLRHERFSKAGKDHHLVPSPWIKGGAIVAIIPKTGEIVAMASYPRYDPNDFGDSKKTFEVMKWLESPTYIGQIWDGIRPLEREFGTSKPSEKHVTEKHLSWEAYLDAILSTRSHVKKAIDRIGNLHSAIYLQNAVETLFKLSEESKIHPLIDTLFPEEAGHIPTFYKTSKEARATIKGRLSEKTTLLNEILQEISAFLTHVVHNDDKILVLDLIRLVSPSHLFEDILLTQTGEESLSAYRSFNQAVNSVAREVRKIVQEVFHYNDFKEWRSVYFTSYLQEKRREEKEKKLHQRAYVDYLKEMELCLFETFFDTHKWHFVLYYLLDDAPINENDPLMPYYEALIKDSLSKKDASKEKLKTHLMSMDFNLALAYLKTMRSFKELSRPLWGRYYFPFGAGNNPTEQALARHFYPANGYGFARSFAFQEVAPLGSTFKIVVGYEGLKAHYQRQLLHASHDLNPLTIIDQSPSYQKKIESTTPLGYTIGGSPITRQYKGGRLPRGHLNIGRIDFKGALERSSNIYFSLLAGDVIEKPQDLIETSMNFGFQAKTGVDLLGEVRGEIPRDIIDNKSALYSFAIGQHSLTVTPLQTARMLASFVNGGEILKPQIVKWIANLEPSHEKEDLFSSHTFAFQDLLSNVGLFFPLFTEGGDRKKNPYIYESQKEIQNTIYLPNDLRDYLLDGLYMVINGSRGTGRGQTIRTLTDRPFMKRSYSMIQPYLAGKTSTAEILYKPMLDREFNPIICKHIWFGGLSFTEPGNFDESELSVIIYLRYGDHGKESVPLATELIKKWREISEKHNSN